MGVPSAAVWYIAIAIDKKGEPMAVISSKDQVIAQTIAKKRAVSLHAMGWHGEAFDRVEPRVTISRFPPTESQALALLNDKPS